VLQYEGRILYISCITKILGLQILKILSFEMLALP